MPESRIPIIKRKKYSVTIKLTKEFPNTPYGNIKKTREKHKEELEVFSDHINQLFAFSNYLNIMVPLYETFIDVDKRKIYYPSGNLKNESIANHLFTLIRQNNIISPSMNLCCYEFVSFLYELQISSYFGAARTLRCILETAIQSCEFQTQKRRPTAKKLCDLHASQLELPEDERNLNSLLVKHNLWVAYTEQFNIYEKMSRQPKFSEIVNQLKRREIFQLAPNVSKEITSTYSTLSKYVHHNLNKFERATSTGFDPLPLSFDLNEFKTMMKLGLLTFDIVHFLYLTAIGRFLDFKNGKEFMQYFASIMQISQKSIPVSFTLPYSKRLVEGIKWNFNPE